VGIRRTYRRSIANVALRSKWRPRRARILFVTGASGFLGRHLVNGPASADWELVAPSSTSLDLRNRDAVLDMVGDWRPTAIAHLAYRKGDRRSIVDASRHIAEAAEATNARLVHMSSDVVFPGRPTPYVETDEPFATSDYARDKIDAERAVTDACPSAVMIRTSLIYGSVELAPVQQDVVDAINGRTVTTFFTDEVRCPAHVDDVADAVARLAAMREISGPLHVAGPDALSRAELAVRTARLLGLNPSLVRTSTMAESGLVRPGRVVLDSSRAAELGIRCRPVYCI
jgi:dTDP-4-dehydrorhamnose reductase